MFTQLQALLAKPALFENRENCTAALWNDLHISKGMLDAHLNPTWDAATRPHATVRENVNWIGTIAPAGKYRALLDLGCGPGIYAELFHEAGYQVTGMDFSKRSVSYAQDSAARKGYGITYHCQDYLTLDYAGQFDIATLINYDFGVLSAADREKLLAKLYAALKPNGLLIFDVFTPHRAHSREESSTWEYSSTGGFFSPQPYLCLNSFFLYEEGRIYCDRHIIITEQGIKPIYIWEHTFTADELTRDLSAAGFAVNGFYGDMNGAAYRENGHEICVVAQKKEGGI